MADFSSIIREQYEDIRVNSECEVLLTNKDICCFVKGKNPAQIATLLSDYTDETDFYSIECRTGSMLFMQPELFNAVNTVITDTGVIINLQT